MKLLFRIKSKELICFNIIILLFITSALNAQMRQIYLDTSDASNQVLKLNFYSSSEGYVAFQNWIGYTTDSGRSFSKKYITLNNVNYNGYNVNLTFGFKINGVKAFNKNTVIAYGHYGFISAILYSNNGGDSFTLIYLSSYNSLQLNSGITDMIFPNNGSVGYAVDDDRILKTYNAGLNWTILKTDPGSFYDNIQAIDDNNVFVISTDLNSNKIIVTINGGTDWAPVNFPTSANQKMYSAYFQTVNIGWISTKGGFNDQYVYKTINGGISWTQQNDLIATPFLSLKMKFINDSTGYALTYQQNTIYKTSNSGSIWEPLNRDNNYAYLGYSHNDFQFLPNNQLWAGGGHGFLELSTNGGGAPLPKAFFKIDTNNLWLTNTVNLINFSKKDYQYKWYVNGNAISNNYNSSYTHNSNLSEDTIKLIVINGTHTDTLVKFQKFNVILPPPPPIITSFSPSIGSTGTNITINGNNFNGTTNVSFGGVAATSFIIISPTTIIATVGSGNSGNVSITNTSGTANAPGFIYTTLLKVTSFSPQSGPIGTIVTITGTNFSEIAAENIVYFGAVSAPVITASKIKLVVSVPPGATYLPISVTVNKATAYSCTPFILTFPGGDSITTNSFPTRTDLTSDIQPYFIASGDFDNDGKVDIVNGGYSSLDRVTLLRNTCTDTGISFEAKKLFNLGNGYNIQWGSVLVVDANGDGKLDLFATNNSNLCYLENISNPGVINFAPKQDLPNTYTLNSRYLATADLEGDGKPDVLGLYMNKLYVYQNATTAGVVSLNKPLIITLPSEFYGNCAIGDINGDSKPDVVFTVAYYSDFKIAVCINTSNGNTISFAPLILLPISKPYGKTAIADFDGDGKSDLAITDEDSTVTILRNTSTINTVSFAPQIDYKTSFRMHSIAINDLNGDSKSDIVISIAPLEGNNTLFSIFENKSVPGNIIFSPKRDINFSSDYYWSSGILLADFDLDGRCDIASTNSGPSRVSIYHNQIGINKIGLCEGGSITLNSNLAGTTYQWLQNSGDGFKNITDNGNFSGTKTAVLKIINMPGSWNNFKFQCKVDENYSKTFVMNLNPILTPSIVINGDTITSTGQLSILKSLLQNGGSHPMYQWQDSTNTHIWQNISGANDSILNYLPSNTGVKVRCLLTNNDSCVKYNTAISNTLTLKVNAVTGINNNENVRARIKYYPNPVSSKLIIDSLRLNDKWEKLEIISFDGKQNLYSQSINGQTSVLVNTSILSSGYYIALLSRKNGQPIYLKFVKR